MLARWPFFNDDAEVVELLDDSFDVATNTRTIFGIGLGRLRNGDDAAVTPRPGRQGEERFGEIGETNDHLLAAGRFRAEHGSLTDGAGIRVGHNDAKIQGIGIDGNEGVHPRAGIVHINVQAFRRQRNAGKDNALLIALSGFNLSGSLSLLFCCNRGFSDANDGLFFLMAGCGGDAEQRHCHHSTDSLTRNHQTRITGWLWQAV
jgi:hypothetical protein